MITLVPYEIGVDGMYRNKEILATMWLESLAIRVDEQAEGYRFLELLNSCLPCFAITGVSVKSLPDESLLCLTLTNKGAWLFSLIELVKRVSQKDVQLNIKIDISSEYLVDAIRDKDFSMHRKQLLAYAFHNASVKKVPMLNNVVYYKPLYKLNSPWVLNVSAAGILVRRGKKKEDINSNAH